MKTMHLNTTRGQPYTSESRKCSHCGLGLAYRDKSFWDTQTWTDNEDTWQHPPAGVAKQCTTAKAALAEVKAAQEKQA